MARTCWLVVLILLAAPVRAQFRTHVDYAVGPAPFSVAIGDFNGDGYPDLAVVNSGAGSSNGVSILLGNGDGTFKAHVDYPAGGSPHSVVAADFNGDGKLDLAIANGVADTISVLIGNGDGTFKAPVSYPAGTNPQWLVAADFNGDGKLDLAVTNYGANYADGTVSVFLGNGDGTFQPQVQYLVNENPFGIMAGDLNHDGKTDLVIVDNNGGFGAWVMLGNGDGTFQPPVYYPTGDNPRAGVLADFNGDGNLDLAVGNCIDNDVSVLLGDGSGHFASPVNYGSGSYIQLVSSGDLDGDGKIDLVTANSASANVSMLKGNGDGTFQTHVDFPAGNGPMWVAVADLNHDGAPDLVVANSADNTVSVLLNKGTDFSIAVSPAAPATVKRGASATATVSMALLNIFGTPQVNLACTVTPTQNAPACSFSPNPVAFENNLGTSTLILDTGTTLAWQGTPLRFVWLAIACLGLAGAGFRSPRRKVTASALGLMLCAGFLLQACGGASTGGTQTQPQTYTITVTGTAGANQHSTTTTLTVD